MPSKSISGTRSADSAVTRFLTEFARYLLDAGVPYAQFTALARTAYFKAASKRATFRNKRVNYSAVAAMTGLTRLQVRELAKQKEATAAGKRDRITRIIEGWATDPRFLKSDLTPRRLAIGTKPSGFGDLVRKYGGDIPPRAILREMQRHSYVTVRGQYVQLDPTTNATRAQGSLLQISEALVALIRGSRSSEEVAYPIRSLSQEITYSGTSAKGRILLQKRSAQRLRVFLEELQAAGVAASIESPPSSKQGRRTTRTRVVLLSEELGEEK